MIERYGNFLNGSEILKEKIKQTNLRKYGTEHSSQFFQIHTKQQKNKLKYYKDFYYRSSYELHFIKFCELNKIYIEQGSFINYFFDNKKRIYFYDFFIPRFNLIIEIKSNYTYKQYEEINLIKEKACLELGYEFIFIIDKKYNKFIEFINQKST